LGERVGESVLPPADVLLARVVGSVGEPDLEVDGPGGIHDVDALEVMVDRLLADLRIDVCERPELVVVTPNGVRIDRSQLDAVIPGEGTEGRVVIDLVPRNVKRDRGRQRREVV